ncbi:me53 [Clostera anachoreta granulovirus]|uniref:Me53 n=1 Tax=Clostera anachoreta granulovirus TaxID=283675 RepID=F4ZL00_9BBAC|nr:me53 [Clostera anachoreta granulovirus]AEB00411.1 me53 [Clostera anachoreta granulovirus]
MTSATNDVRAKFITRETQEVFNEMVGMAQRLITGMDRTQCYKCKGSFRENDRKKLQRSVTTYIFIVISDYLNLNDETFKLCCLRCCKKDAGMMDVIELYPTLTLHSVKKLMYFNVVKKFFFNFVDTDVVLYKKYVVVDSLKSIVDQIINEKMDNDEIQRVRVIRNDVELVAEDCVFQLRVDYGSHYNFDRLPAINNKLIVNVDSRCKMDRYHVEVYYKRYEEYAPFSVYYNRNDSKECAYCANKVCPDTGHVVFYCGLCGPTDVNYFVKRRKMMFPFWKYKYNYNKVYWKTKRLKGLTQCSVMLYGVDTRRS